jgi:uncharacterized protein (TIGR00251 family)
MIITISETAGGLTFNVYVQPRASKCAIVGEHQNALKVRLTAPPVEGAANKQCIELLAKALAVSKSQLTIIGGLSSRHKQIYLNSADSADQKRLKTRLQELSQGSIR